MLDASIVGSLPKPVWLAPPNMLKAPWRLSGTDLQVPAPAADDRADNRPRPVVTAPPSTSPTADRTSGRAETMGREPEVEHLSLSIGSIEVIVDPPERPITPAPVVAAPPAPVSSRAVADPIMRLRRQYVTWPDVD